MKDYISYDLIDWGQPFERRVNILPHPSGLEVQIRVTAAGLCHSDLHVQKGYMDLGQEGRLTFAQRGAKLPMTFGHEIAGIVESVGPDVTLVRPGQQVLVFPWVGCGECQACFDDRESDCPAMRNICLKQKGGFATHCLVENEKFLVDIEGLNATDVVPHACSGVTVFNALEKIGPLRDREWLGVMGCGGLGLNAIAISIALGISNIIAIDVDDTKLDAAIEMGAASTLNSNSSDALAELQNLAEESLVAVIDTFGGTDTGQLAVRALV